MRSQLIFRILLVVAALSASSAGLMAQKKITPVESDEEKPQQPVLHYYDKHGNPLQEPVLFLAELDTVRKAGPRPVYPLLTDLELGVNFFDAIMAAAGQKHQSIDVWAALPLFNWVTPVVELGLGFADDKPEEGNFHYKGKPSFYGKIGFNYNFLYKSSPDYQVFVGFRAGYSHFSYDITDITVNSPYWDQSNRFSITGQKASAWYGEALAGLRVKIWRRFSMGWTFRYKFKFHTTPGSQSSPWFIPGYGATSPISATFSLIYYLPVGKKKAAESDVPTQVSTSE